jgi:hypothetical protein
MRPLQFAWLLLVPALGGAEIYRWVDDTGVVNYTQHSPEGIEADRIVTRGGAATVAAPIVVQAEVVDPNAHLSAEQKAMMKRLQETENARQAEIARIKESNCGRAQGVLEKLSSKGRIRVRNANGQETAMPEDERQSRIAEAQRDIVNNCQTTVSR